MKRWSAIDPSSISREPPPCSAGRQTAEASPSGTGESPSALTSPSAPGCSPFQSRSFSRSSLAGSHSSVYVNGVGAVPRSITSASPLYNMLCFASARRWRLTLPLLRRVAPGLPPPPTSTSPSARVARRSFCPCSPASFARDRHAEIRCA